MANILAVDDDANFIRFYQAILSGAGHSVTTATSGEKALQLVRAYSFDLIITDILMPGGDGIAMIMDLRQTTPKMKIIAVSAGSVKMDGAGYLELAQKLGATTTLNKPLSKDDLLRTVNSVIQSDSANET